jgi:protein MpaA
MSKPTAGSEGRENSVATTAIVVVVAIAVVVGVLLLLVLRDAPSVVSVTPSGSPQTASTTVTTSTTSTTPATPPRQTIASSVRGRPIELYTFGSGPWRVLIIGGIHGSERGGPVARKFIAYLQEHPAAVPAGTFLQLVPSANPDGEAAHTRANANGVDLNRNFPSQNWQSVLNAGDRPTAGVTGGTSPGSEPETAALLSILDDGWDVVISLHSPGGILDPSGAKASVIAERMSALCGLTVGGMDYQPYITGSLGVYMTERQAPLITMELESGDLTEGIRAALLSALTSE